MDVNKYNLMLKGLIYFCLRVERGTIRSRETYNYYIRIIEAVTEMKWDEIKIDYLDISEKMFLDHE